MFQIYIGIYRWFWQWFYCVIGLVVELYEDDVLDFNVVVVVFFWVFWRVFLNVVVVIVEDFGVWVVWISVIYLLEVVRCVWCIFVIVDVNNMFVWDFYFFFLDFVGFVVVFIDGNLQMFFWQGKLFFVGQQFLCKLNGIVFEIVVEVEVVQYFEEGMVMCGVIDVFQVVVFIICMYVVLGSGSVGIIMFVEFKEYIFELVYFGVGK